jgi:hypothetical protein
MNALQIIPTKPVARVRRSALRFRVSDAILLLALVGGMSMSRGEEGAVSEPGAAVVTNDNRDKAGGEDKSPSLVQPAAVSAGATTEAAGSVRTDQKAGGDAGEGVAAEAKSDTAVSAETRDRNAHDRDSSRVLAKLSTAAPASTISKNDLVPKPEDAKLRKAAPHPMAVRSAGMVRRANQPGSAVDDRSRKAADGVPVWAGPPPIIYGYGAGPRSPYAAAPADATNRQGWMSSAVTGTLDRVVDAPVAVLSGGKQALYGVLDSLW